MTKDFHTTSLVDQRHDKLILIDFDHTLFNTTVFVDGLKKELQNQGVAPEDFDKHRQELKACCSLVDIDTMVARLANQNKKELHSAIHAFIREHSQEFIFPDVHGFLERHKENFDIVVLTQGDEELQSEKIDHSDLPNYVQRIITQGGKETIVAKLSVLYDTIYFIDDKAKHIDEVKTAFPNVKTYFMSRPDDNPYGEIPSTCDCADLQIHDLSLTLE